MREKKKRGGGAPVALDRGQEGRREGRQRQLSHHSHSPQPTAPPPTAKPFWTVPRIGREGWNRGGPEEARRRRHLERESGLRRKAQK